jgi:8-amino-7-oxononanoate synthase
MICDPYAWIERSLQTIHKAGWYRSVPTLTGLPGPVIEVNGHQLLNFASNDYLGLAGDCRLIDAAIAATREYGTGTTGSRLLTGHRPLHHDLEQAIAQLKQTQAAMVFSSGYTANLGAISALVGQRDVILADRFNHASLQQGAMVSGAQVLPYAHSNMDDLRRQLQQHRQGFRRCLIVSDTVFSMDGDLCPLPRLLDLADAFDCMVLVDEAHATGVIGASGSGCVEYWGCRDRPLVHMGTLSKALGSLGGYVAGSAPLIDFLRNRAPSWIYTTGLAPAAAAAALAAVKIVQQEPQRRDRLWSNVAWLKQGLMQMPTLQVLPSESAILCLQMPDVQTAQAVAQHLQQAGIFAPAIRPPTVPTSRIRLTLMATHQADHIAQLLAALRNSSQ